MRNFEEVPFDLLAWSDSRFRMTWRRPPELLQISVQELGILNPLIVTEGSLPGRYVIVTGWLRFLAARAAGEVSVPCHIFRSVPSKIMLLTSLLDNIGHRRPNPVEQSVALQKLGEHYTPGQIEEHFFPLIGLERGETGRAQAAALGPLAGMRELVLDAVAEGALAPETAAAVAEFPFGHSERLVYLFRTLRTDPSTQLDLVRQFGRLWNEQEISPTEVILDEEWDWAAPPPDEPQDERSWPSAPEAAGCEMPIPVDLDGTFGELEDSGSSDGRRQKQLPSAGKARQDRNVLLPGNRPRSDSLHLNQHSHAASGPGELPSGVAPEERVRAVCHALNRRIGSAPQGGHGSTCCSESSNGGGVPAGVRLVQGRKGRGSFPSGRLEIRFENPEHLRSLLHDVLQADERGALFEVLAGKV